MKRTRIVIDVGFWVLVIALIIIPHIYIEDLKRTVKILEHELEMCIKPSRLEL